VDGRKPGRPPKPQGTVTLEITLPQTAFGYLSFLAKNTMLGATENEIATLILRNQLIEMAQKEFHRFATPQG